MIIKKQKGLTLIEAMVVITMSIIISVSLMVLGQKLTDKFKDKENANLLVKITSGMDNRFSVDGFTGTSFNNVKWVGNKEVSEFLNGFNGQNSGCSGVGYWVPNVEDIELKDKNLKTRILPCNLFSKDSILSADKISAVINKNNVNNQILMSYVLFEYKNNKNFEEYYPRWIRTYNEAYNQDSNTNTTKNIYGFINKDNDKIINKKECFEIKKDCGFIVGVVSDEASSLIHLSTIGENKQVGKISFSKGILNPQVCQSWSKDASGNWTIQKTICGIENKNEKIGFKLNTVNSDFVMLDNVCDISNSTPEKYLNVTVTGNVVVPVSSKTVPCGIFNKKDGEQFLVTSIFDDTRSKELYVKTLSTGIFSVNEIQAIDLNVNNYAEVDKKTTITDNFYNISSFFIGEELSSKDTFSTYSKSNKFIIGGSLINEYTASNNVLTVDVNFKANNVMTKDILANLIKTPEFISRGPFDIGGDIITKNFYETGILSAANVEFSGDTSVNSSGAFGGYAETGGFENTSKKGITAGDVYFAGNAFIKFNHGLNDKYVYTLYDSSNNLDFGITSHGGAYLSEGLNLKNGNGQTIYSINKFGDLSINANYAEFNGCCSDTPTQFYGDLFLTGTYTVNSIDRFTDVVDLASNSFNFPLDTDYILPRLGKTPNELVFKYKTNSLVNGQFRLSDYAYFMTVLESNYNSLFNSLDTPGLKGEKGQKGNPGVEGDIGNAGLQGDIGDKGPTGPIYDPEKVIWLPEEVVCANNINVINNKYITRNAGKWTYNDVIEGLCETTGEGKVKYFERPIATGKCFGQSEKEFEIYECKKAKYRIEPYAYNLKAQGNFCVGDSEGNLDPKEGIVNVEEDTICYTDLNKNHIKEGRARRNLFGYYYTIPSDEGLGYANDETSLISIIGKNKWVEVDSCGTVGRSPEDIEGLLQSSYIEENMLKLEEKDLNSACINEDKMSYIKIDNSSTRKYGSPFDFKNYKENDFKNPSNYNANNSNYCKRTDLYQIHKCEKGYSDLTKVDYSTHPKGFVMPKQDDVEDNSNGLTGVYIWMKGEVSCINGSVKDSYPGATEWYSTDKLYDRCSLENSYRYEYLGTCGTSISNSNYQMFKCRDNYYKPTISELKLSVIDLKCLNRTGQGGSIVDSIDNYYPNLIRETNNRVNGEACTVERQKSYFEDSKSISCAGGEYRYTVYECR